jgi:hypothetical protein
MQALQSALSSGNLSSAQQDFASVSSDVSGMLQGAPSSQSQQPAADLQALQSALNTGNLAGAQKDFATLKTDLQAAGKHHGHHHQSILTEAGAPAATSATGTSTGSTGTSGTSASSNLSAMLAAYAAGGSGTFTGLVNAIA